MKTFNTILFLFICLHSLGQPCVPNTSSLLFDGSTTYVDQTGNNNLSITGSITVEAWINAAAWGFSSAQGSIVCKHGWTVGEEGYVLRAGGLGELSFNIAGLDVNSVPVSWVEVLSPSNALQLNTWYHVAGTFDGNQELCYINGVQVGITTFQGSIVPSPDYSLKIGKIADNQFPGRYWDGMIDEVRIWNRALSASELQANMNKHIDPISAVGLVSYWRFNENSGPTTADLGTGGNTGTIVGATWVTTVPFSNAPPTPTIFPNGLNLISSAISGNQWYVDGNLIPGATSNICTPVVVGNYTVVVTDLNGCSATSAPFTVVTIGISDDPKMNPFHLWPNPSNGHFNISLNSITRNTDLQIYNATGNVVLNKKITTGSSGQTEIDASQLTKGIYSVKIISGTDCFVRKLVMN